jgi:hypothetical protein
MPIPKPEPGESKDEFLDRCMSDPKMVSEYGDDQRFAVCSAQLEGPDRAALAVERARIAALGEKARREGWTLGGLLAAIDSGEGA